MRNTNRVVFNTFIQYIQLVLNVLIGLISVRFILSALGEIDYGIYDVVGGVVGLFAFFKGALSRASMRFLSIRIGAGNIEHIKQTFCSCFWLHFFMSVLLAVIIEFVGLFLFDGFLNIPSDRIVASKVVYHSIIVTLFFSIISSPFNALIAAHEQFWYSSLIGIVNSLLKLFVAIILLYYSSDKLIFYGICLSSITIIDFLLVYWYANRHYHRMIGFSFPKRDDIKEISGFFGWTLLDTIASIAQRQGYSVLFNRFFGPIVNTTYALAKQVDNHLYVLSSSVITTMKPQALKSYGSGDEARMFRLSMTAGKIGFVLMSLVSIPLIFMMPDVLVLWLKSFPDETVLFTRLLLIACMIEQLTRGLVFANQAVGNIKWFSIIVSSIRISAIPISLVLFLLGFPARCAIYVFLVCEFFASFSRVIVLSRISNYDWKSFWGQVIIRIVPSVSFSICLCYFLYLLIPHSIVGLCLILVINGISYGLLVYYTGLTVEEKLAVRGVVTTLKEKFRGYYR